MNITDLCSSRRRTVAVLLIVAVCVLAVLILTRTPSHDRQWTASQAVLPYAEISEDEVTIFNIRNNQYTTRDEYVTAYYDKTFNITDVTSVEYIIEPFASVAAAHTFLSFGLQDGSQIAISAEARREKDEKFRISLGPFRQYELMYVIVDERDALGLRAIHRDNPVVLYPTVATAEQAQELLISMLQRANDLSQNPEFYNIFTNSCTTNIADHVATLTNSGISWDYRLVLPKESDALAYELSLLDNNLPLEYMREQYDVTDAIKRHINDENFSQLIRSQITTSEIIQ